MKALAPVGRFLFSILFILSGLNHFRFAETMTQYAQGAGVPGARIGVLLSGAVLVIGGVCVLLGVFTRVAAAAIAGFLILSALLVHDFWSYPDAMEAQNQMSHFLKNIALAGGALLLSYFGPGPVSVRARRRGEASVSPHDVHRPLHPRTQP